jgi:hypothetical protein
MTRDAASELNDTPDSTLGLNSGDPQPVSVWCDRHTMEVMYVPDGIAHVRHGSPCTSTSFTVRREATATPGQALSLLRMAHRASQRGMDGHVHNSTSHGTILEHGGYPPHSHDLQGRTHWHGKEDPA